MIFLIIAGTVSFIFGLLLLFAPETLRRLSNKVNEMCLYIDNKVLQMRIGIGISLILVAVLSFFVVYYIIVKLY